MTERKAPTICPSRYRNHSARLILDEYEMGVLDEKEAGDALFDHLFGEGRKKINAEWSAKGYI